MVWYHMSVELADRPSNNRTRAFPFLFPSLPFPFPSAWLEYWESHLVMGDKPMIDEWSDE